MKKVLQKVVSFIALGAIAFSGIFGMMNKVEAADAPRFNYLAGDYKMLQGANRTQNDADYSASPTGKLGDTFAGMIYYHNGVENTTAHNVRVKVSMPSVSTNGKFTISSAIMSDDAGTVTDDMIVNLSDGNGAVEFIPGSVKWMPNAKQNNNAVSPFVNGQTGNELVGNGLNIGNVQGCWDYAGFITFLFKTSGSSSLSIEKSVRNVSENQSNFVKQVNANNGEEVEFKVVVSNPGTAAISTVNIKDVMPAGLMVKGGTLLGQSADESKFFGSGIVIPSIAASGSLTYLYRAIVASNENKTYINTAYASNAAHSVSDTATVIVKHDDVVSMKIDKLVRNVTLSENEFVDQNSALAGDTLEYQITISNDGNTTLDGVLLKDILPVNVNYLYGTTIVTRAGVDQTYNDALIGDGLTFSNFTVGECIIVRFRAVTVKSIAAGEILTNTATVQANGLVLSDIAKTVIKGVIVPENKLPKTGAETFVFPALGSLFGGLIYVYRKKKSLFDLFLK
ncbi:MAG: LPXTG cell wall anchor domain-containing protein [Candidatus Berkelbacteria bacterium]